MLLSKQTCYSNKSDWWNERTWITGSWVGSGKWPLRPAHSMSKLNMRNGAIFENSPSGAWLISSECLRVVVKKGCSKKVKFSISNITGLLSKEIHWPLNYHTWGYRQSNSNWLYDKFFAVFLYFPASTSIQLPPTMLRSIIKRRAKRTLLSYVMKLFTPKPSIWMPLSRIPANFCILTRKK